MWPARTVAVPPAGVRKWVPYRRAPALTQRWVVAPEQVVAGGADHFGTAVGLDFQVIRVMIVAH